ncbi:MAG: serine dehydratase subunit alpha family protein [Lachnospiraceae bacterium]|nr:L-serine ammonia-lyase, iron-sulfur-dependent, subunit alpha [uncultured Acetatifactor sp.]MCI9232124.1 serine dehydratase subunit alpha family protein [Lachnospiraceae bacterium]MCI9574811.1 serine dehydratase subunit alpha family protein [Lachnospiraceae bacterium]
MTTETIKDYISILREELVPATGCTEPIALAYAAARLRDILGAAPEEIRAEISGNIIKNVKSVVVPNTGGRKGIPAAIAAGVVAGDAAKVLQVIARVSVERQGEIASYAQSVPMEIVCADTARLLDIRLIGRAGEHTALVHIANSHSNIVREERDGEVLLQRPLTDSSEDSLTDKSVLNVADILEFADKVDLEEVAPLLGQQVDCNTAIAREGLKNSWGANIGSVLLTDYSDDIKTEAKAWAAAGSDARMSGCELPVVILSGSGNQGITASVPVVRYAMHLGADREKLYRALLVSDLVTIHQKSGIGRLSAYCGAVSAGVGAGAGIAYLLDGSYEAIAHTIVNAVAIISGTICDGAKPSCAAKIAASVDAGILGYHMYRNHQEFKSGDGIVTKGVDNTIANVGILASQGMRETDQTILSIMTERCV